MFCAAAETMVLLQLQLLGWRCVECAIHHERDVCEEQHPYAGTEFSGGDTFYLLSPPTFFGKK